VEAPAEFFLRMTRTRLSARFMFTSNISARQGYTMSRAGIANKRDHDSIKLMHSMGGVSPLQVMLEAMHYHRNRALSRIKQAMADNDMEAKDTVAEVAVHYGNAVSAAKDAAPFIHPRLVPRVAEVDDPVAAAQAIRAALQEIEQAVGVEALDAAVAEQHAADESVH
jgi:hypothetical protein